MTGGHSMKKNICLLFLLMILCGLFACGKNKEPAPWQTAEFESFNYNNVENALYRKIQYAKDDTVFFQDYSAAVFITYFFSKTQARA